MRLSDRAGCIRWTLVSRSRSAAPTESRFPVETELKGKDLLFIAGGVGLAPLHSVINYCRANRANYGADRRGVRFPFERRSAGPMMKFRTAGRMPENNVNVHLTIDRAQEGWDGHVAFVPNLRQGTGL